MKRPIPNAGPNNVATSITTNGFATIARPRTQTKKTNAALAEMALSFHPATTDYRNSNLELSKFIKTA